MSRQRLQQFRYPLIALALTLGLLILHSQYRLHASSTASQRVQTITISNSGFLPSQLICHQGDLVSLMVVNTDTRPHNLVIEELQVSSTNLKPSQSTTLQFTAAKKGRYTFISSAPGYPESGYRGVLIVE
jgi:plastocyanin